MRYIKKTLLFLSILGCNTSVIASDTIYFEQWDIDNLELIGGHEVTVLGDPEVVSTAIGDAIQFDGDGDQLLVDFNPIMDAKAFTVELVFFPDACYPDNPDPRFLHIQDPNDPDEKRAIIELRINENNQCYMDGFMKTDLESLTLMDESMVHDTKVWQHVAITYEDNVLTTYFNGVQELSGAVRYSNQVVNTMGKTSLGARMNERKYFSGLIKTLRVTHVALEPENFIFIHDKTVSSTALTFLLKGKKEETIFPNPADREFNMKMSGIKGRTRVDVKIFDSSGRIFYSDQIDINPHDVMTIDTSGFKEGIYWVHLQSDQGLEYGRIIVTH